MKSGGGAKLIQDLGSRKDMATRRRARETLTKLGSGAIPCLLECLDDRDVGVRWEAAKILQSLQDPAAASLLLRALEDENFSVQWVAAGGLVALGRKSVAPLLEALVKKPESEPLREGAHHVLRELEQRGLLGPWSRRLIKALHEHYGHSLVGPYASEALRTIRRRKA